MQKLFAILAGVLMAACVSAAAEERRLTGVYAWSLAVGEGRCEETWRFGDDGLLTVESGEEITTSSYVLRGEGGTHVLERTRLSSNGAPDCLNGRNPSVGQRSLVYLVFLNGGGFFTCANTDTMSCYGVATPRR